MIQNISISNIDLTFVKSYLKIESDFTEDDIELSLYIKVAKQYLMERCGLTEDEFNQTQTLAIPYLMLVAEFYTNKGVSITTNSKVTPILDMFITISKKELF